MTETWTVRWKLAAKEVGIHTKRDDVVTFEEEQILGEKGQLGSKNPQQLINTLFSYNCLHLQYVVEMSIAIYWLISLAFKKNLELWRKLFTKKIQRKFILGAWNVVDWNRLSKYTTRILNVPKDARWNFLKSISCLEHQIRIPAFIWNP